jgi:hypothetical protein
MANFYSIPETARLLNATQMRVRGALSTLDIELPKVGSTKMVPREWLPRLADHLRHGDLRRKKARSKKVRVRLRLQ